MNYRIWQAPPSDAAAQTALQAAGYGALFSRVLAARGVKTPQQAHSLLAEQAELSDPYRLKDMDKAVERIRQAIENEESIVIFGDYDVDGVSATAILYECLSNQGAHVRCKLPSRDGGGYGLNEETVRSLAAKGYKLVITVDNGITAVAEADCAAGLGLDLVITDHHLPGETLPRAAAVVDPNRADDESPCKSLCGAGVAFKLCAALEDCAPGDLLEMFGELAALGTIADMMPLLGENRTIVQEGLAILQDTMRPGLQALLETAGYAHRPVTAETVSFGLAPRLNAAGRMDSAARGPQTASVRTRGAGRRHCGPPAGDQRRRAKRRSRRSLPPPGRRWKPTPPAPHDRVLVVAGEGWHPGVIGIVASRLMERYGRPAIVIAIEGAEGRGSGRAPAGFHLHAAHYGLRRSAAALRRPRRGRGPDHRRRKDPGFPRRRQRLGRPETRRRAPAASRAGRRRRARRTDAARRAGAGPAGPVRRRQPGAAAACAKRRGRRHLAAGRRRPPHPACGCARGAIRCLSRCSAPRRSSWPTRSATAVDAAAGSRRLPRPQRADGLGPLPARCARPGWATPRPAGRRLGGAARRRHAASPNRPRPFCRTARHIATVYRMIRAGGVPAGDLQPVFAALGPENTGRTLASAGGAGRNWG